jgi:hypothetical protein
MQTSQSSIQLPNTCPVETLCSNVAHHSEYERQEPDRHELYLCGDRRLGPVKLPTTGVFKNIFDGYDRHAAHCPHGYLSTFWELVKDGPRWIFPKYDGFAVMQHEGKPTPITADVILPIGTLVDRFGHPGGAYLAPAGTPFKLRAIPMENLSRNLPRPGDPVPVKPAPPLNYYLYNVTRELLVRAGPIAPHFGDPGNGLQFYTNIKKYTEKTNVQWLLNEEYLKDITPLELES